jgi:hypothetical protein
MQYQALGLLVNWLHREVGSCRAFRNRRSNVHSSRYSVVSYGSTRALSSKEQMRESVSRNGTEKSASHRGSAEQRGSRGQYALSFCWAMRVLTS